MKYIWKLFQYKTLKGITKQLLTGFLDKMHFVRPANETNALRQQSSSRVKMQVALELGQ